MKFEFSADIKGIPTAQIACKFECSPDELVTLISDPVYQQLGKKLINEVSFKPVSHEPAQSNKAEAKTEELLNRVSSVFKSLQKEAENLRKAREFERRINKF